MSNDYFKAQGWFKNYALNSQDSRGVFQQLVKEDEEAFRLASAETDKIKNMMNKKYGSGTMKYGSEISQPPQRPDVIEIDAINAFMRRNPAAEGGRIKFEKGLRVEDLTETELVNAQSAARKSGITSKKGSKEFADFVGGDNYTRLSTKKTERLEAKNIKAAETAKSLDINEIAKLPADVKLSYNQRTKLFDSYHDFFKEAYDERVKVGEPFGKADIARDVIKKIELKYPKHANNLDFFPGKNKDLSNPASYYEYIDPKKKSSKFRKENSLANTLTKEQMSIFKGNEAKALKQTKNQEKIFKALQNGINEIDDLVKETGMSKARVNQETAKLVNNMFVRTNETPMFLRGEDAQNAIGDVYNSLVDSKTMAGYHTRNIRSMIYDSFPDNPEVRKFALSKVKEFDKFTKDLKKEFPGLEINYDHPGSYRALKNLDFKNFLNVTPIVKDINAFKSRFDNQSVKNLNDLAEAKANYGPNSLEYKAALKKQRSLERVWSNLTGDKSSLGKLRLNRQQTGTTGLDTEGKNLIDEFTGNLKIREEIAKNIDESVKFYDPNSKTEKTIFESLEEVLPTQKGKTRIIDSAKKITSKDALDMDKQILAYVTDRTGTVKQPMLSSGLSGAYEMLSDDLKAVVNSDGFKKFANSKTGKTLSMASKTPGKLFGVGDVLLGYLDYTNNEPLMSKAKAYQSMLQAMSFNLYKGGDRQNLEEIKAKFIENGGDGKIFDQVVDLNKSNFDMMKYIENIKKDYTDLSDVGYDDLAKERMQSALNNVKKMGEENLNKFEQYKTDLAVSQAGAPIQIKDITQPIKDTKKAAFDLLEEEQIKNFPVTSKQVNTESGPIGNKIFNSIFTKDSYKKLLPQNWLSTFNQMIPFMDYKPVTEKEKEQALIDNMEPRELYLYNLARGQDPDNPITINETANFMNKNKRAIGFSEGGITGLRSKYEYKK